MCLAWRRAGAVVAGRARLAAGHPQDEPDGPGSSSDSERSKETGSLGGAEVRRPVRPVPAGGLLGLPPCSTALLLGLVLLLLALLLSSLHLLTRLDSLLVRMEAEPGGAPAMHPATYSAAQNTPAPGLHPAPAPADPLELVRDSLERLSHILADQSKRPRNDNNL